MTAAFPTIRPSDLKSRPEGEKWLVERLWGEQAVGIVGGEPKCCKSFLALDIAVAVASGTPCLRRFPVAAPGTAMLFAAEDAQHILCERLEGIAGAAGVPLDDLAIEIIDVPKPGLDSAADVARLAETVARVRPKLLVLDPLVRLHAVDENQAGEIAPLLGSLRDLQIRFECAVLLARHARKDGRRRGGQALRGSTELHAWGDSNLYVRRRGAGRIALAAEHRGLPGSADLVLELVAEPPALALAIADAPKLAASRGEPRDRILDALAGADAPTTHREIRARAGLRAGTVVESLRILVAEGRVEKTSRGCRLAAPPSLPRIPGPRGNGSGNAPAREIELATKAIDAEPAKGGFRKIRDGGKRSADRREE